MGKTIRNSLSNLIADSLSELAAAENLALPGGNIKLEYPPQAEFGHYSTPAAMEMARVFRRKPAEIARALQAKLEEKAEFQKLVERSSVEGPGFLNFFLRPEALSFLLASPVSVPAWLDSVFSETDEKHPVIFEFVSANPTGPLNIVSARAAVVGDSICRVLRRSGKKVHAEYYVNDYGNQVRLLGLSFAYRYGQSLGLSLDFPADGYQGEYIRELMSEIVAENKLPLDLARASNLEAALSELGDFFAPLAIGKILATHKRDLHDYGVHFNDFFSEASLHASGRVEKVFEELQKSGQLYESEGAWYFASTRFGDDKDRVVMRSDGRPTYLMADIAYHKHKIDRGFSHIYDIWGPDHHGYIARLAGALKALGFAAGEREEKFEVLIVQQVNMLEEGKPVVMSKRLGKFQTMRDLIDRIPVDVARYFFVTRSQSTHLDFDLDLALTKSRQNPVYYIQYAHARIHSIFREAGLDIREPLAVSSGGFVAGRERDHLLFFLARFPEEIEEIARNLEVHRLTTYLYQCATLFTAFYHHADNRIVQKMADNPEEARFLLRLAQLSAGVLAEGLALLGISAPEEM